MSQSPVFRVWVKHPEVDKLFGFDVLGPANADETREFILSRQGRHAVYEPDPDRNGYLKLTKPSTYKDEGVTVMSVARCPEYEGIVILDRFPKKGPGRVILG